MNCISFNNDATCFTIGTDRGFGTNGDNSKIEENISLDEDIKSDKNFVEVS